MTEIERVDAKAMHDDMQLLARTPIAVTFDGFTWLCVLGALQLAFRHPAYTGPSSDVVRQVAANIQALISLNDRLALVIDMGWHPEFDVAQEAL